MPLLPELKEEIFFERPSPGFKVLDLGTGTADVALAIAKELEKQGGSKNIGKEAVIGLDPSQNMLSHGRKKVHKAGFSDKAVKLIHGDALNLTARYLRCIVRICSLSDIYSKFCGRSEF